MSFNSIVFLTFLAVILFLYYILPAKVRNTLLLAASYVFYAYYSIPLVGFLILCTFVVYFIARKIDVCDEAHIRKRWLVIGLILNIGTLGFYKYLNFFLSIILGNSAPSVSLVVPLGISFIIFSTISYLVDVYRKRISAEKRILRFALYVSFFPKLVQGPIIKAEDLLEQFDAVAQNKAADWDKFRKGFLMLLYGLFMKMVVADRLALPVNAVYAYPSEYSGAALILATLLFSLQIYFDFAGYSLIAIGSAKMFGIDMKDNFRQPYLSGSVSEFWRRWHISLNQWLTDYLYIPLGGSRCSRIHAACNTLITFGLSGLWHGANWGYIIWGLLNGVYVVIEKRIRRFREAHLMKRSGETKNVRTGFGSVVTFILVSFSWLFFRAETLSKSRLIVSRIFMHFNLSGFWDYASEKLADAEATYLKLTNGNWIFLLICLIVCWIVDHLAQKYPLADKITHGNMALRWLIWLVLIFTIIIGGMYGYGYSAGAFIYAQF